MQVPKRLNELGQLIVAAETYIFQNNKVLMHKRAENKEKFPGFWIGPGGHVEQGEDALTAAIREVKEETGVIVHPKDVKLKVIAFHHHIDRNEVWVEYLFRANIPAEQEIQHSPEGISEWIGIEDLMVMDNVFPPSKYYFDHILNDKPGILYNSSEWKESKLLRVLSEQVDSDF